MEVAGLSGVLDPSGATSLVSLMAMCHDAIPPCGSVSSREIRAGWTSKLDLEQRIVEA